MTDPHYRTISAIILKGVTHKISYLVASNGRWSACALGMCRYSNTPAQAGRVLVDLLCKLAPIQAITADDRDDRTDDIDPNEEKMGVTQEEWDKLKTEELAKLRRIVGDAHKQLDEAGLPIIHTATDDVFFEGERLKARLKIVVEEKQAMRKAQKKQLMRVRQLYAEIYTTLSEAKVLTANTTSMFLLGEQLLFSFIKGEIDPADSEAQEKSQKEQGAALNNSTPAEREALSHIYGFLKHHGLIGKWENSSAHIAEAVKKVLNQWHELQFKKITGEDDVSTLRSALGQRNQILRDIATQFGVVFFGDLPNRVRVMQEKLQMIGALITK